MAGIPSPTEIPTQDKIQARPSLFMRASQTFWLFAEQGGLFSRALFLWTLVFGVDLLIYLLLTLVVMPSQAALDYLAPDQLSLFKTVLGSYLLVCLAGYVALLVLDLTQETISDAFLGAAILLSCANFVNICHFFGGIFVIIAPIFLIITVTNVSIFLSPRLGRFALFISLALYFGSIALQKWGYLSTMSVVAPNVTVSEIFTNPFLVAVFTIALGVAMFMSEYFVIHIVAVTEAQTEQTKRLNLVLEASNRQLSELDTMKDNFLSMVSHDLRTPLTGVMAYAEIVRDRRHLLLPADLDRFLDIIIEQSKRLGRLINDLLDVQRFEAHHIRLEFKELDLVPLLREAVDAFRAAAREKDLALTENFPDRPVMVRGHRDRLHQAVANLLSNAVKFTPSHGRIETSARIKTNNGRAAVVFEVKDTGPGIPAFMQKRLFEKFQHTDKLVRDNTQGSGLGLAIMREIIELHGGEAGVSSGPGQGSTFYFTLPLIA